MCTSITYQTLDGRCFLGRTMDFDALIPKELLLIPRSYCWHQTERRLTRYAVLGMGLELPGTVGLYDGLNEKGLMCATLMFEGAGFNRPQPEKDNVSTCDFVMWVLSQFRSVEEVVRHIGRVNLVFGGVPPLLDVCALHWIVSDTSSRTIVIEQMQDRLSVYEDPFFTLTNDPSFPEQVRHCQKYRCVDPFQVSRGLPGDFSSESRFVRAAYCRRVISPVCGEQDGLANCFKILDTVQLQKGVDRSEDGPSYTQYTSCMCGSSLTYYYNTYGNRQINAAVMAKEYLNAGKIKKFPIQDIQSICWQN